MFNKIKYIGGFPGGASSLKKKKKSTAVQEMQEMQVWSLGWEDSLEKEMATHPSILVWEIPSTEEPGGLQSMGSKKSQTQLSNWTCASIQIYTHTSRIYASAYASIP